MSETQSAPGFLKKWMVATRPFSLPASTMPVLFGTVLAVTIGGAELSWVGFVLSFFGMASMHLGANLMNDAFDFDKGIDQRVNPVSGGVVRGWMSSRESLVAGLLLMGVGTAMGAVLIYSVGWPLLIIGLVGLAIGVFYTWGPLPLKYNGLGDLAVFLDFGVLGALGSWTVQTGEVSWVPAVWAIPMSLLVIGILHANNWRDIPTDEAQGATTIANLLGDRASQGYYAFLLFGPFAVIALIIGLSWGLGLGPRMPLTFAITLLSLPLAIGLMRKAAARHSAENPLDFLAMDGATAQYNLAFGLLCTLALGLDALVGVVLG